MQGDQKEARAVQHKPTYCLVSAVFVQGYKTTYNIILLNRTNYSVAKKLQRNTFQEKKKAITLSLLRWRKITLISLVTSFDINRFIPFWWYLSKYQGITRVLNFEPQDVFILAIFNFILHEIVNWEEILETYCNHLTLQSKEKSEPG